MFATILFMLLPITLIFILLLAYIYNYVTRGLCKCSAHLVNKVAIVTGANSGIGYAVAEDLAQRGARVILACRNEQRAADAVNKIKETSRNADVTYRRLNLASFASIEKFASGVLESEKRLDILINNAATFIGADEKTEDGYSLLAQTNYIGPFLLTSLLLPLLKASAPSRIINVSSITHSVVLNFDIDKLHEVPERMKTFTNIFGYFKTKLCINLMTFELARRLQGTGVTVNCLHPGSVRTNLVDEVDITPVKLMLKMCLPLFKSTWEGAQTVIYLAVSPELETCTGGYYVDCKLGNSSGRAQNVELAQKFWEATERLVTR